MENMNPKSETNQQIVIVEHLEQMLKMFQQMDKTNMSSEPVSLNIMVAEKLTYHNYTMWCKLMYIAIEGRERLDHIIAAPPDFTSPTYQQWKQRDSVVLSWIIVNTRPELVNQFLDYTTAWDLWKGIETLFNNGRDELQIFDLSIKAANLKQNVSPSRYTSENYILFGKILIVRCRIR